MSDLFGKRQEIKNIEESVADFRKRELEGNLGDRASLKPSGGGTGFPWGTYESSWISYMEYFSGLGFDKELKLRQQAQKLPYLLDLGSEGGALRSMAEKKWIAGGGGDRVG